MGKLLLSRAGDFAPLIGSNAAVAAVAKQKPTGSNEEADCTDYDDRLDMVIKAMTAMELRVRMTYLW